MRQTEPPAGEAGPGRALGLAAALAAALRDGLAAALAAALRDGLAAALAAGLALPLVAFGAAPAAELRAGYGRAELPAEIGGPLGGYGGFEDRLAGSVLDPPLALAVVVEDAVQRVALVALDLVIVRPALREELLARARDLDVDRLAVIATHTHSGPGGYVPGWLAERVTSGEFDPGAVGRLAASAEFALRAAVADLDRVTLTSTTTTFERARNRRDPDGPSERELPLLVLQQASGRPILLFAYGAHPTVLSAESTAYSADYPAAARRTLADSGYRAIFLPGPLGDQEPIAPGEDSEADRASELGVALGQAVRRAADTAPDDGGGLSFAELWVDPPPARLRRFCPLWWVAPIVRGPLDAFVSKRVPFQAMRLGRSLLVTLPAEPSSALGARIRETLRTSVPNAPARFVVAHGNDWLGYGVSRERFARGGYEACMSLHGPEFGDWLVDQASLAVRSLAPPETKPWESRP